MNRRVYGAPGFDVIQYKTTGKEGKRKDKQQENNIIRKSIKFIIVSNKRLLRNNKSKIVQASNPCRKIQI